MMQPQWYMNGMQPMPTGSMQSLLPQRGASMPASPSLPPMYPAQTIPSLQPSAPAQMLQLPNSVPYSSSRPSSIVMPRPDAITLASPMELNPSRFPTRDINLMSPSTIVTPIQASPARTASVREAMRKFTCDYGCGFMGGFEEVSLHERVCYRAPRPSTITSSPISFKSAPTTPRAGPMTPVSAMQFNCDYGCGFVGTFKEVEDHERTCKNAIAPQLENLNSIGDKNERRYHCDYGCGFEGSFQAVEMHEKNCDKRLATPAAPAAPKASPPAPGAEQEVFYCQFMCGFKGSFAQVDAHEATCTFASSDIAHV